MEARRFRGRSWRSSIASAQMSTQPSGRRRHATTLCWPRHARPRRWRMSLRWRRPMPCGQPLGGWQMLLRRGSDHSATPPSTRGSEQHHVAHKHERPVASSLLRLEGEQRAWRCMRGWRQRASATSSALRCRSCFAHAGDGSAALRWQCGELLRLQRFKLVVLPPRRQRMPAPHDALRSRRSWTLPQQSW